MVCRNSQWQHFILAAGPAVAGCTTQMFALQEEVVASQKNSCMHNTVICRKTEIS